MRWEVHLFIATSSGDSIFEIGQFRANAGSLLDMRQYIEGGHDLYIKMDASELGSEIKARRTASLLSRKGKNDTDQDPRPSIREASINLPSFDLVTIATATDDFALINKIGECGFGHVYKGVLPTGREMAMKRVSKDSGQGLLEFKNEKRIDIIVGIARGLLYVHRDSRLRIIHRDLKATSTKGVIGTCGYMPPEYTMDGLFPAKSDIFSFGVLVLEIVSGKRNRGFYDSNHDLNLLGHHPEDRPSISLVLLMLDGEQLPLPQPKQPGFYTSTFLNENTSSSIGGKMHTGNELTISMLQDLEDCLPENVKTEGPTATAPAVVMLAVEEGDEEVVTVVALKHFWHILLVARLPVRPQLLMQRVKVSGTLNSVSSFSVL
ncbi:hypothetical protein SLEP1_g39604 [Rubroshorea leprosula]|uniref:Protein kinase domain-containing protein n=1 Tax=Rubroshorea leprosula TaxID=152421 RepID=A0AAV5L0Z5_9ROSI|nr:hypothetical protein SLEP1_g39604 [Rubroshorea leprosula]